MITLAALQAAAHQAAVQQLNGLHWYFQCAQHMYLVPQGRSDWKVGHRHRRF